MFFLAHFRGFVAFVVLWFGLSKFQNLTVHVSIVRCQYEELSVNMPFEAAQSRKILAFPASHNPRPQLYFEIVSFL